MGQTLNERHQMYNEIYGVNESVPPSFTGNDYKVLVEKRSVLKVPFSFLLWLYKSFISDQLSSDCSFNPSCSRFSYRAIHEMGIIKGICLTADRLTRCNGYAYSDAPWYLLNHNNAKVNDPPSFYRFSD
jgi:putative component of membrane protein insertase Oxa1/YidC/SpoIIIJ protein YidD